VALSAQAGPADLGWFAYTPLSNDSEWRMTWNDARNNGSTLIVSRWQLAGYAVAAIGLMVVAAGVGLPTRMARAAPSSKSRSSGRRGTRPAARGRLNRTRSRRLMLLMRLGPMIRSAP